MTIQSPVAQSPDAASRSKNSKGLKAILAPALLMIVGLLVMSYPVVSTLTNNYEQRKAAKIFAQQDEDMPSDVKERLWERAHEYNRNADTGPILDPWLSRISDDNTGYQEYLQQLNYYDAMARIVIPSVKIDLPVYHGTRAATLRRGVGHLYGSDLPVGGEGTHSVLTGHTGLSTATLFDNLAKVKDGEFFYIQAAGHKLKYQVDQIKVVLPDQTDDLAVVPGKDYVTLITCTPYGINTHRLLVRGHQVPMDPADEEVLAKGVGFAWQWWMYALIAAVIATIIGLIWWVRKMRQKLAAQAEGEESLDSDGSQGIDGALDSDKPLDSEDSDNE